MAIKRTYRLTLEVEYNEVDENGKVDENTWIESTYFKTVKEDGKDLHVQCLKPNVGIDPFFNQLHKMQDLLDKSVVLLKQFEKPEKVLGKKPSPKTVVGISKKDVFKIDKDALEVARVSKSDIEKIIAETEQKIEKYMRKAENGN